MATAAGWAERRDTATEEARAAIYGAYLSGEADVITRVVCGPCHDADPKHLNELGIVVKTARGPVLSLDWFPHSPERFASRMFGLLDRLPDGPPSISESLVAPGGG